MNSYNGAMLRVKLTGDRTPYNQFLNFTQSPRLESQS